MKSFKLIMQFFLTSLATNYEDIDGATSKGQPGKQVAKQRLAEYTSIYKEYEQLEKTLLSGDYKPELLKRHGDLQRKLALKEQQIRKVSVRSPPYVVNCLIF